jgi:hypothetical protein
MRCDAEPISPLPPAHAPHGFRRKKYRALIVTKRCAFSGSPASTGEGWHCTGNGPSSFPNRFGMLGMLGVVNVARGAVRVLAPAMARLGVWFGFSEALTLGSALRSSRPFLRL